jgi:2-polyprenyl-6-methoxyphenol hydroxylase-like FAD-dependent oxidoreductase
MNGNDQVTSAKPEYSGLYCFTTHIRPDNPFHSAAASLAGAGNYIALGEGKQLVILKLHDGSYHIGVGLHLPEEWRSDNAALLENPSALREWLVHNSFAEWPKVHTDMIQHSEGDVRAWPLYSMPAESLSWKPHAGVTLIGDAAHAT